MEKTQNKNKTTETTLEKITIALPKSVVNYYKTYANSRGLDPEMISSLIAFDVVENIDSELQNNSPDDWKEFFNLKSAFDSNE